MPLLLAALMNADGSDQVNPTNDPPVTEGTCDPDTDICDPGTFPPEDANPAWQPLV